MQTPEQAEKRYFKKETDKEEGFRQEEHEPTRFDVIN